MGKQPTPTNTTHAHTIILASGGLVAGDRISLCITVATGATLTLLTQGSTKVFKQKHITTTTVQRMDMRVAKQATLILLPEPTTCFADAHFTQRQRFQLEDSTASLIALDWFTSGRYEQRGEAWQFRQYDSAIEVYTSGKLVLADRTRLTNPATSTTDLASALEPYHCHAMLIVYGTQVTTLIQHIRIEYAQLQPTPRTRHTTTPPLIWFATNTRDDAGIVVRAAALTTQHLRQWIRTLLSDIRHLCGQPVYDRIFTN
jgi:urease accessory protein